MKFFKLAEDEFQHLAAVLGEFPAAKVIKAIDILRNLPEITHLFQKEAPKNSQPAAICSKEPPNA